MELAFDDIVAKRPTSIPIDTVYDAITLYKEAKSVADRANAHAAAVKELIAVVLEETGEEGYSTPAGKCYMTKPGTSVRYDTKALDALRASSPEMARILDPHRTESERAGSLTIR